MYYARIPSCNNVKLTHKDTCHPLKCESEAIKQLSMLHANAGGVGSGLIKDAVECLLLDVMETGNVPQKFYLSPTACAGILNRAKVRGKKLPPALFQALQIVSKQLATITVEPMDSI